MDETWGLSWSQRWHKIDPEATESARKKGIKRNAVTLCSKYVYTQDELREPNSPLHLRVILAEPEKAKGVCKHCTKRAAAQ